jgi:predicted 2-oxoglutarate/Fe(II)-dependent dioxygenase YbiX
LNLNTGEYEGGHLRFPEYGPHLYRPGAGDAIVFSCSLVHEVMPISAGKRFALITFFYGEDLSTRRRINWSKARDQSELGDVSARPGRASGSRNVPFS